MISMGVYVKGMQLPKNCKSCEFRTGDSWGNWCEVTKNEIADETMQGEKKNIGCPLLPVQEHGRLIDADALEASCFMGSSSFYTQSDIDYAPTIITAEGGE